MKVVRLSVLRTGRLYPQGDTSCIVMTNLFINIIIIIVHKFLLSVENILVNVRHSHNLFKICCNHTVTEAGHLFYVGITPYDKPS